MKEFDVKDRELLNGANLIEASAGTGKTFSIAVLVVRLIIEKSIPVTKMLLVTFTDAAATELKERSIKFIRDAISEFGSKGSSGNDVLTDCVSNFITENENGIEDAINRLYSALLDIDQAKIATIHSFCQQTLNEFAFETNQSFGKVLLEDVSQLINKYCNAYRREALNSMEYELFEISGLKEENALEDLVKNSLSEKILYNRLYEVKTIVDVNQKYTLYKGIKVDVENNLCQFYNENIKEFRDRVSSLNISGIGLGIKKKILNLLSDYDSAINMLQFKETDKVPLIFNNEVSYVRDMKKRVEDEKNLLKLHIHGFSIDWVLSKIKAELVEKNKFTFDDLINQLYLVRSNVQLQAQLRSKYDVIFLDEFQDTDQKQYEIFREIFQNDSNKILFYIGDPKQSIYGFRKADLNTYFRARNSIHVARRFEMKVNFRSSRNYIDALNTFFKPIKNFDTFHTSKQNPASQIEYTQVEASKEAEGIKVEYKILPALTIIEQGETKETFQNTIKLLLDAKTTLNKQKVKPSNICVLTRSNRECKEIKRYLNELNVPSVISDDSRVIKSAEAIDLGYILGAFLNSKKSSIQKALLTAIVGLKSCELHTIDMDKCVELFTDYYKLWNKNGIYVAVTKFLDDFNVINKHNLKALTGQRILSNTRQLLEILQEKETHASLTPNECYSFLKSEQKTENASEINAYIQRIESDEDAVKIVTIHKSKGLEYDIVIAPFLDMKIKFHHFIKYYNVNNVKEDKIEYVFTDYSTLSKNEALKELFELQNHQENARLLYVALTRAKYGSFILSEKFENTLAPFIDQLRVVKHDQLLLTTINEFDYWNNCNVSILNIDNVETVNHEVPKLSFPDANYNKMSYSFLASHPSKLVKELKNKYDEKSYDEFVFSQLQKGAKIGSLLHEIFEFIDYSDDANWDNIISKSVVKYVPNQNDIKSYFKHLRDLVTQVLNAKIEFNSKSFSLTEITRDKRRNEFEFNFSIPSDFKMMDLEFILDKQDEREIATKRMGEVQGMMTGFIDLFFEYNGKYYILDWKSNFLGDSLADYDQVGVAKAMNESNYHLQYLIYALAIEKYLRLKLSNFDFEQHFGGVIYLFLRGNRNGEPTGVFQQTIKKEELHRLKNVLKIT
jgi:exodeoxyribonuclease V beta subunit